MTKEEAVGVEEAKETKNAEGTKEDVTKPENGEASKTEGEKEDGTEETTSAGTEENKSETDKKEGEVKGRGRRQWPWSRKKQSGQSQNIAPQAGETPTTPSDERTPTDQELESDLSKRVKELEQEKAQLNTRIELYKKVQTLEQEVASMRNEAELLKRNMLSDTQE